MAYTFYRGDSRTPAEIKAANGFSARVPLTIAQARDLLKRCNGLAPTAKVVLPAQAKGLQDALDSETKYKLLDLVREIKREKSQSTVHISTDLSEDCGGYSSGHIYRIEFEKLNSKSKSGLAEEPDSVECTSHFDTYVVMETNSTSTAQTIALSSKGKEVSFLTSIPYENISAYKAPGGREWKDMP